MQVEILEEVLIKLKADVIVNSCNPGLLLNHGGMSRHLVAAAGPEMQTECSMKYPSGIDFGGLAVTAGHKLTCKAVYHVALPHWDAEFVDAVQVLQSSVGACLDEADNHGMVSIAFPALGCGFLNYPHDVVAQTMQQCIHEFNATRPSSKLKKIIICVHPKGSDWKHIKEAFVKELMTEEATSVVNKLNVPVQPAAGLKPDFLSTCVRETRDNSCKKVLQCGHTCSGYRGERVCLPCIQQTCSAGTQNQTAQDDCIVCYSDHLGAAPVAKLNCGHMFHLHCVKRILQNRWVGAKISFNFTKCPICKETIEHPELRSLMAPIKTLEDDVRHKALLRLEYDGLTNCSQLTQPSSKYYQKPEQYAMDRYIYYICFKCKKAFFGGTEREGCATEDDVQYDPANLICPQCRGRKQNTDAAVARIVHSRQNAKAGKMIKETTKACPHCGVRTEKNGGCMHMTCVKCRMDWCWLCEIQWNMRCQGTHWMGENGAMADGVRAAPRARALIRMLPRQQNRPNNRPR